MYGTPSTVGWLHTKKNMWGARQFISSRALTAGDVRALHLQPHQRR